MTEVKQDKQTDDIIKETRDIVQKIALAKEIEKKRIHQYFTLSVKEPYEEFSGYQVNSEQPTRYYERVMKVHTIRLKNTFAKLLSIKTITKRDNDNEIIITDDSVQTLLQAIISFQEKNPSTFMETLPFQRFRKELVNLECLSQKDKLNLLLNDIRTSISYDGYVTHVNSWSEVTQEKFLCTTGLAFCLNSPFYLGKAEWMFQTLYKDTKQTFAQVFESMLLEFKWPLEVKKFDITSICTNKNTSLFKLLVHSGCTSLEWNGECGYEYTWLTEFIQTCPTLKEVSFSTRSWQRCWWSKEVFLLIMETIGKSTTITSTNIPNYFFGREDDLCEALNLLDNMKQLKCLSFSCFTVTDRIADKLIAFIEKHPLLYEMYFIRDRGLSKDIETKIDEMLKGRNKSDKR